MATIQLDVSGLALTPKRIATATTKIASTRYSAFKKAIAPAAMLSLIRPIRSVPTSCLETQDDFINV
jgi:hypothetical protein